MPFISNKKTHDKRQISSVSSWVFIISEWRDSNSRPPAPKYAQNRIEWLRIVLFCIESPSYLFKVVLFGFVSFWMNNAQTTHKTAVR
nr:MAG TPA: hypothetical protein [Bacteriophage sp.]